MRILSENKTRHASRYDFEVMLFLCASATVFGRAVIVEKHSRRQKKLICKTASFNPRVLWKFIIWLAGLLSRQQKARFIDLAEQEPRQASEEIEFVCANRFFKVTPKDSQKTGFKKSKVDLSEKL